MSKTKGPPPAAIRKAASPESRAKAVATMKRRRAEKAAQQELSLDAIPDRVVPQKKKYVRKPVNHNTAAIKALLTAALALLEGV